MCVCWCVGSGVLHLRNRAYKHTLARDLVALAHKDAHIHIHSERSYTCETRRHEHTHTRTRTDTKQSRCSQLAHYYEFIAQSCEFCVRTALKATHTGEQTEHTHTPTVGGGLFFVVAVGLALLFVLTSSSIVCFQMH